MYKHLLARLLQIHGEDHVTVVNAYNGISKLLADQNRLDDAIQMLDKSIEICIRLQRLGDLNVQTFTETLRNRAILLQKQGKLEAATGLFTKVLAIQIKAVGQMDPRTADAYEDLAGIYVAQAMQEEGVNTITKALKIRRKVQGDYHPMTMRLQLLVQWLSDRPNLEGKNKAQSMINLAGAMIAKADFEKANQLLQLALDICKENFWDDTVPIIAAMYENMATVKIALGLWEDAISASAEALKIRRRTLGDDHADTKRRMEAHRSLLKRLLENRS